MSEGWIKLHREVTSHWIWEIDEPFSKRGAWIDLLLMVNHKKRKLYFDGELIECRRGETITSETKLADRWGWSRTKLRSFLELLENDGMIKKHTKNKRYTIVSICEYDTYQKSETTEKQNSNNTKTSQKQQKNINKNVKNDKKVKNTIGDSENSDYEIPEQSDVEEYFKDSEMIPEDIPLEAEKFINHYEDEDWTKNNGKRIKNWRRQAGTWKANYKKFNRKRLKEYEDRQNGKVTGVANASAYEIIDD